MRNKTFVLNPIFNFRNRILILLAILCMLPTEMISQVPQQKVLEVKTKKKTVKIQRIVQDENGFIWLGTDKGVWSFDGLQAEESIIPDGLTTAKNTALHIYENHIYCGFEDGMVLDIDKRSGKINHHWKYTDVKISCIQNTADGSIWVATEGKGLIRIINNKYTVFTTNEGLADNYVHELCTTEGNLAAATDLGLSMCILNQDQVHFRNFTTEDGLTDNLILSITEKETGVLLLGMQNGTVSSFIPKNGTATSVLDRGALMISPIVKILCSKTETLVVTEADGTFMFQNDDQNKVQQFYLQQENETQRKPIDCILASDGNMLITFGDNKIILSDFRIQFIGLHDGVSFNDAQCVLSDQNGVLWFANSEGIFKHAGEFSSNQFIQKVYSASKNLDKIVTMCEGPEDAIYFGTFGSGFGRLDKKTGRVKMYTEKNGLINDNVLSMTCRENTIWMATLGGVAIYDISKKKNPFSYFDSKSKLGINYIYTVFNDRKNRIWLGTDGKGLVRVNGTDFIFINEKFPESGKSIISITEDEHGNVWYNSTDKGLQWTNEQSLHDVKLSAEDEEIEVFAIHHDPLGNILALTTQGLASINHHTEIPTFIDTKINIGVNYLNVMDLDEQGRMWIGTESSLIRFNEYYDGKEQRPITWIKGVDVMLQSTDTTNHRFHYDQNHFTFHLTSIWLNAPEDVQFQYKLEGYDIDWQQSLDRVVTYSKLDPAKYIMRVRSSINGDWQFADEKLYAFEIRKPYWKEIWFFALLAISGIALIWWLIKLRLQRLQQREVLAREKVQSQFDTLRNQVNPHFLFNSFNTLISIISTDSKAAVGYVEKLSDYFRIVLQQRDKDVITVKEELELVKNYLYLQKQRFGVNLEIDIQLPDQIKQSVLPPLTFQLLVENAIKHNVISKNKPLRIQITLNGEYIQISNNIQEKLSKEPSTGIGLPNIRHRYKILFNREIHVENDQQIFSVKLPINKQL